MFNFKSISKILLFLSACAMLASCGGGDEPDNPQDPDYPSYPDYPDEPDTSIESIVKDNVEVKCTYSDYAFTITFKSTLKSELPSADIKYGVGHGDVGGSEIVSLGTDSYSYSSSMKGSVNTVTITNPFWFYFIFDERDDDKSATCEMYYKSYIALKEKGLSNLSSEEKELYRELTKGLDKYEAEARRNYHPSAQVKVNNKFFNLKRYQIP